MKYLVSIVVLILTVSMNMVTDVKDELENIAKAYANKNEYAVKLDIYQYDSIGNSIGNYIISTAQEGTCFYTNYGDVISFKGIRGTVLLNKISKELYYSAHSKNQTLEEEWKERISLFLENKNLQYKFKRGELNSEIQVNLEYGAVYKYIISYSNTNYLVKSIKLFSNNVLGNENDPIKGYTKITYSYSKLNQSIKSEYDNLIQSILNRNTVVKSGKYQGYSLVY